MRHFKHHWKRIVVVLFSAVLVASAAQAAEVGLLTKEALKPMLDNPDVVVLDVRTGRDWSSSEFKVKGAVRAEPGDFDQWSAGLEKGKKLVLYCA